MAEEERVSWRRKVALFTIVGALSVLGFGVAWMFDARGRARLAQDMTIEVSKIRTATLVNGEEPRRQELGDRWEALREQVVRGRADLLRLAKARAKLVAALHDRTISGEEIEVVLEELD